MWALEVIELDPFSDTGLCLGSGHPGVQIDTFLLQGPPELFDHSPAVFCLQTMRGEDVNEEPALAIHPLPPAVHVYMHERGRGAHRICVAGPSRHTM